VTELGEMVLKMINIKKVILKQKREYEEEERRLKEEANKNQLEGS